MRRVIQFRRRPAMGSITWGNRAVRMNGLGLVVAAPEVTAPAPIAFIPGDNTVTPIVTGPFPIATGPVLSRPPIVVGGTFPIPTSPVIPLPVPQGTTDTGLPGTAPITQPVVVTPSSGTIPDPATVAAATTTDTTSWFEQQMITGIPNWMLVAGAGVLFMMHNSGGKKR